MASARIAAPVLAALLAAAGCGGSAATWTERGDTLLRDNDLVGAELAYNRAIALQPHSAEALYGKGWVLYASGFDRLKPVARQLFQRSIEYQPEYFGGYRGRGVLLLEEGQVMAAEKLLRTAFEKDPDQSSVLASLGQLYLQGGRIDEAEQLFERAMQSAPARGELRRYLAEVAMARGDVAGARAQIEKGRASKVSGKRGLMILDEGEERVLLETARLLLEDPGGGKPGSLDEAQRALDAARALLGRAGGAGMSGSSIEQRRRYHELLAQRIRERRTP
jgi:predicted Zn-dependent protease